MISSFFMGARPSFPCSCRPTQSPCQALRQSIRPQRFREIVEVGLGVSAHGGIEAMIFDFGNVLIGWDPENLYRKLIPDAAERTHFLTEICHGQWNALQDAGRTWEEAIAERIALHPERAEHIRAYRDRFAEMLTGPVAEGHAILDKVHAAGVPCYGLTNWSSETYYASRDAMPFLDRMKYTAVSGDLKMAKPEPEIF